MNTLNPMVNKNAGFWIRELGLQPHPEGGYFREVYRSDETTGLLPGRYNGDRCFGTSIYFLLEGKNFSAFHKIKSDETWHFYYGCSILLYIIDESGNLKQVMLGNDPINNETLQYTIPHGMWFAAQPVMEESFSLIGCTVSPGFEFDDLKLGDLGKLSANFPDHIELLRKYCIR